MTKGLSEAALRSLRHPTLRQQHGHHRLPLAQRVLHRERRATTTPGLCVCGKVEDNRALAASAPSPTPAGLYCFGKMSTLISRPLGWALYTLFLAFVAEIVLRLALSSPEMIGRLGGETEASWEAMWLSRHNRDTEIYYQFDRFHERRGWASRPLLRDQRVFGDEVLNTNSAGFRGTREFAFEKAPGTFRIAVLGDSFTFGDEVSDHEAYPAQLHALLPRAEIINMGVHGYGHDQMLLLFEDEGVRYRPDLVILGFVAADMYRNLLAFRDYAKPSFVLVESALVLRGVPVPPPEQFLRERSFQPKLVGVFQLLKERFMRDRDALRERAEQLTAAILDRLAEGCRASGAALVLFYIPVPGEAKGETTPWAAERAFFETYCSGNRQVSCGSALSAIREEIARGRKFEPTPHWDSAGNRVIAESLRNHLCETRPLVCDVEIGASR